MEEHAKNNDTDVAHSSTANVSLPSNNEDHNQVHIDSSTLHAPSLEEGGWGWVIVASNFIMLTMVFGYIFALSVFYVEWLQYFNTNATMMSLVITLCPAIKGVFSKLP